MSLYPYCIRILGNAHPWRVFRKFAEAVTVSAAMLSSCIASDFVSSGTSVMVQFSDERFLVGADSRVFGGGVDPKDADSQCKIVPLGTKMFFVISGRTGAWDTDRHKPYIDANAAAKQALEKFRSTPNTQTRVRRVLARWVEIMSSEFTEMFRRDPDGFFVGVPRDNLASAVFAGTTKDGSLVAYTVYIQYYFSPDGQMPKTSLLPHLKAYIVPWNYDPSAWIWIAGAKDRIGVIEFISGKSDRAAVAQLRLKQTIASTPHPDVEALTMQFAIQSALDWAIHKEEVGGAVDVLELRKGGSIHWITVKPNCQDLQQQHAH